MAFSPSLLYPWILASCQAHSTWSSKAQSNKKSLHIMKTTANIYCVIIVYWASLVVQQLSICYEGDAGDARLIPGSERSPGGGYGNPLQYYCLENSMDRGAWWATIHGVTKSQTWLQWLSTHTRTLCFMHTCHASGILLSILHVFIHLILPVFWWGRNCLVSPLLRIKKCVMKHRRFRKLAKDTQLANCKDMIEFQSVLIQSPVTNHEII